MTTRKVRLSDTSPLVLRSDRSQKIFHLQLHRLPLRQAGPAKFMPSSLPADTMHWWTNGVIRRVTKFKRRKSIGMCTDSLRLRTGRVGTVLCRAVLLLQHNRDMIRQQQLNQGRQKHTLQSNRVKNGYQRYRRMFKLLSDPSFLFHTSRDLISASSLSYLCK